MVRHEILWLADTAGQLANLPIAPAELLEQPPAERMSRKLEDVRGAGIAPGDR
jgi:hypothetical protein